MPPILTYSFLFGLVGSCASVHGHFSLRFLSIENEVMRKGRTDIIRPFQLYG